MLIFTSKHIIGLMTYINYIIHTIYFNYYFRTSTLGLGKKRSAELLRGAAALIRASLAHKRPGWRLDAAHIGRIATRAASPSPGSGATAPFSILT